MAPILLVFQKNKIKKQKQFCFNRHLSASDGLLFCFGQILILVIDFTDAVFGEIEEHLVLAMYLKERVIN